MQRKNDKELQELQTLLTDLVDDNLTTQQIRQLENILSSSKFYREYYIYYLQTHTLLNWECYSQIDKQPSDTKTISKHYQFYDYPSEINLKQEHNRNLPPTNYKLTKYATAAAIIIFSLFLGIVGLSPHRQINRQNLKSTDNFSNIILADYSLDARLIQHTTTQKKHDITLFKGTNISNGTIELIAGIARLKITDHTSVFLTGPAQFSAISENYFKLEHGTMMCSSQSIDNQLTIEIDTVAIEISMAEIAIKTKPNNSIEIYALRGTATIKSGITIQTVQAGEAVIIDGKTTRTTHTQFYNTPSKPKYSQASDNLASFHFDSGMGLRYIQEENPIVDQSLEFPNLQSIQGSILTKPDYPVWVNLDTSLSGPFGRAGLLKSNGTLGTFNKPIYISWLVRSQNGSPNGLAGLSIHQLHHRSLLVGKVPGYDNFSLDFRDGHPTLLDADPNTSAIEAIPVDNNIHLFVIRIDAAAGLDNIRIYFDPTVIDDEPIKPNAKIKTYFDCQKIRLLSEAGAGPWQFDSIRIGSSWRSVLPISNFSKIHKNKETDSIITKSIQKL
ncbi:hypothetical protein KS4_02670 [Poriferisphaera corsica]|uniref:FecR protein domain-containing protein n=1 Tax=Poriferisphaera corsica TaxID=2528020 RepID=A0A517YPU5_9BACT|nr:hypothetical protein [Poriferisphaera corsica]QDU32236.1 hypothetical protein KS4_02670 [Poriferisphaera corsica]